MKLEIKSLAIACAALIIIGFTSCDKSEDQETSGDAQSVFVKISNGPSTRSTSPPVSPVNAATPLVFTSGFLYFVSGTGQITQRMDITSNGSPQSATSVDITTLAAGATINMPASSRSVHLVGNIPASVTLPTSGTYSLVEGQLIPLNTQYTVTAGVPVATIYGGSSITPSAGANPASAAFNVHPLISRIEISQFTGGSGVAGTWKIDGIFLDRFNFQQYLNNTPFATSYIDNGSTPNNYRPLADGGTYPTADNGMYYDYNTAGIGTLTGAVYAPTTAGNVFAYSVFSGVPPHVVIRITGVTGFTDPQFLTIKLFRTAAPADITDFAPGVVYKVSNVAFTAADLSEDPEEEDVSVVVTATLVNWTYVLVTPQL